MTYHETKSGVLYCGDCLEVLRTLPDNSVDSIVTDPPYGLAFMGKKWDYDVPSMDIWLECFRVLKPGGHLLAFAGTRTQHRMAVRIEDAGFEIRDMLAWIYGSGFPKSLDIGKAVDKLQGNERKIIGEKILGGIKRARPDNADGHSNPYTSGQSIGIDTIGTSPWEGWGTALKPAFEPITVARKPIEGTVAANVLKWGTGGINIDGCRVGYENNEDKDSMYRPESRGGLPNEFNACKVIQSKPHTQGRFPANFIHDGSDEVLELFPETKSGALNQGHKRGNGTGNSLTGGGGIIERNYGNDSGSAARFFYCAKASKAERNMGCEGMMPVRDADRAKDDGAGGNNPRNRSNNPKQNHHPTVKPIALMRYLIRLVTPPNGTVLDPFLGSGTTAIAAIQEGFDWIGIEREAEYCDIARARIDAELEQTEIDL